MASNLRQVQFLVSKKRVFLTFIFILGATLIFIKISSLNLSQDVLFISPLGSSSEDKILKKVKRIKTIDKYPPSKYFPQNFNPAYKGGPEINAKAYAVMDRKTNTLLLAKNHLEERSIASLAKIMTALVALESAPLDYEITVSSKAAEIGEASMGLSAGERLSLEDLLFGLLLPSGNDAALALAEGLARKNGLPSEKWFVNKMNEKSLNLGLFDTYFVNPTGLDEETKEKSSFSTALDLLALANYALENKKFAEIVATKSKLLPYKQGFHKAFHLNNILGLSKTYPGIKGIKPGTSVFSGNCLASYAEKGDQRIIVVLLDSPTTKDDATAIYDFLFDASKKSGSQGADKLKQKRYPSFRKGSPRSEG